MGQRLVSPMPQRNPVRVPAARCWLWGLLMCSSSMRQLTLPSLPACLVNWCAGPSRGRPATQGAAALTLTGANTSPPGDVPVSTATTLMPQVQPTRKLGLAPAASLPAVPAAGQQVFALPPAGMVEGLREEGNPDEVVVSAWLLDDDEMVRLKVPATLLQHLNPNTSAPLDSSMVSAPLKLSMASASLNTSNTSTRNAVGSAYSSARAQEVLQLQQQGKAAGAVADPASSYLQLGMDYPDQASETAAAAAAAAMIRAAAQLTPAVAAVDAPVLQLLAPSPAGSPQAPSRASAAAGATKGGWVSAADDSGREAGSQPSPLGAAMAQMSHPPPHGPVVLPVEDTRNAPVSANSSTSADGSVNATSDASANSSAAQPSAVAVESLLQVLEQSPGVIVRLSSHRSSSGSSGGQRSFSVAATSRLSRAGDGKANASVEPSGDAAVPANQTDTANATALPGATVPNASVTALGAAEAGPEPEATVARGMRDTTAGLSRIISARRSGGGSSSSSPGRVVDASLLHPVAPVAGAAASVPGAAGNTVQGYAGAPSLGTADGPLYLLKVVQGPGGRPERLVLVRLNPNKTQNPTSASTPSLPSSTSAAASTGLPPWFVIPLPPAAAPAPPPLTLAVTTPVRSPARLGMGPNAPPPLAQTSTTDAELGVGVQPSNSSLQDGAEGNGDGSPTQLDTVPAVAVPGREAVSRPAHAGAGDQEKDGSAGLTASDAVGNAPQHNGNRSTGDGGDAKRLREGEEGTAGGDEAPGQEGMREDTKEGETGEEEEGSASEHPEQAEGEKEKGNVLGDGMQSPAAGPQPAEGDGNDDEGAVDDVEEGGEDGKGEEEASPAPPPLPSSSPSPSPPPSPSPSPSPPPVSTTAVLTIVHVSREGGSRKG